MTVFGNFHFIRPMWLVLLPILAAVWWLVRQSDDPVRTWRNAVQPELLRAMIVGADNHDRLRGAPLLAVWTLAVIAVAGPTWRPEPSPFADDPVPVMIVLKANETMDLSDLSPSRMERARLKIADFASERPGQPLGLVAYAGTSHLVLPPTRDTAVVATMAAEISPAIMPKNGDDLAGALKLADDTLGDFGGSIVVVADTVDGISPQQLADLQIHRRCTVHMLAIARADSPEQATIERAAASLQASVTMMTADDHDVTQLVRRTANTPVAVAGTGKGTRWSESGWWLVPVIAILVLISFRRDQQPSPGVAT